MLNFAIKRINYWIRQDLNYMKIHIFFSIFHNLLPFKECSTLDCSFVKHKTQKFQEVRQCLGIRVNREVLSCTVTSKSSKKDTLQEFVWGIHPNADQPQSEFHRTVDGARIIYVSIVLSIFSSRQLIDPDNCYSQPHVKPMYFAVLSRLFLWRRFLWTFLDWVRLTISHVYYCCRIKSYVNIVKTFHEGLINPECKSSE